LSTITLGQPAAIAAFVCLEMFGYFAALKRMLWTDDGRLQEDVGLAAGGGGGGGEVVPPPAFRHGQGSDSQ
jgi:hypothetical protein